MTECRGDAQAATIRQSLQIRQGDQEPITVVEYSHGRPAGTGAAELATICRTLGNNRHAPSFHRMGVFHRLGVSPDGSQVVFEVTDEDQLTVFPRNTLPTEQKGIFIVRADGTGLRRLGPPSRDPPYLCFGALNRCFQSRPFFVFSPNGRAVAYTDRGPSRDNEDAIQIFTLDLVTGDATQMTQLPPALRVVPPFADDTCCPFFTDDRTITFLTFADVNGENPNGEKISVAVNTGAPGELTVAPPPVVIPGSELQSIFRITGAEVGVALLTLPGESSGPFVGYPPQEVFTISGDNVLQLTNFGRADTNGPTLSADGQRVFFAASGNPLGTNPTENCQIWSDDRNGGDLRQLTDLREVPEGQKSKAGCAGLRRLGEGCTGYFVSRDAQTDELVFASSCNPVDNKNPYGFQVFAVHQDGTRLRQLTNARGYTFDAASGAVTVELPYPVAHPGQAQL
jgi:hypothetical protein